jgi:uncharacterized protein (TIGR00369 family)
MSDGRTYPPPGHIIRHLRMDLELRSETELHATMPISDDIRDAGGALRTGALATFVDVAAGTFSHEMVRPDWLATSDMKLHLVRPAFGSEVRGVTSTVRAGRRNMLSATVISDAEGEVARSWVTYTRLPRRDDNPTVEDGSRIGRRLHYVEDPSLATERDRPMFDDYLGLRIAPEGLTIELDHHPRIHNSFGSLQGGAAAALVERLAMVAAEHRFGTAARVTDLHVHYLGQTRTGPFRVDGEVLRADSESVTCEVCVLDAGNDGQLLDLGTATAIPVG